MKAICQNILIATLALGGVFTACQEEDTIEQTVVETILPETGEEETTQSSMLEAYNAAWVETLGEIDPNHDWSAAMRVTAKIYLREAAGEHTVRIYTHNPINPNCRLLAEKTVRGASSIAFDVNKSQTMVYITATNDKGYSINNYFTIKDNSVEARTRTYARSGETCETTVKRIVSIKDFQHPDEGQYGWGKRSYGGKLHYLDNIKTNEVSWNIDDLKPILGGHSSLEPVLPEGSDNRNILLGKGCEKKIELIMLEEGPATVELMCGGTVHYDQFGYYYYFDDDIQSKVNANKYILIEDARPSKNISCNGEIPKAMDMPDWVSKNGHNGHTVTSKEFHMVYFDENGNASYTFPKGIHIGFFIIRAIESVGDNNIDYTTEELAQIQEQEGFHTRILYSTPELNGYYNMYINGTKEGEIPGIIFNYSNDTYVGFEDNIYGDKDMNDIFFHVSGNFINPEDQDPTRPKPETFMIACEDLGSVYDLDFNDIVFSISHVGGTNTATITPLAAGGILPAYIKYNNTAIGNGQEFHELFVLPNETNCLLPINANAQNGHSTKALPITIEVEDDFTLSSHINNFSIEIMQYENQNVVANKVTYGQGLELNKDGNQTAKAPMMLILPDNWKWPKEEALIYHAYQGFKNWTNDQSSSSEWHKDISDRSLVVE